MVIIDFQQCGADDLIGLDPVPVIYAWWTIVAVVVPFFNVHLIKWSYGQLMTKDIPPVTR